MGARSRKRKRFNVGLTGGFSSGKSTTRELFKRWGAKTFDADTTAHQSLKKTSPCYSKIVRRFGKQILTRGQIDRSKLGAIVFHDAKKRAQLEAIIHPYVIRKLREFLKQKGILVAEVPLLFEAKLEKLFDFVVVVAASEKEIRQRAKIRFASLPEKEILNRIRSQMPLSIKKKKADRVFVNDSRKHLVQQVARTVQFLNSQFEEKNRGKSW